MERYNHTPKEMAKTMLHERNVSNYFCAKAIPNHVFLRPQSDHTPYKFENEENLIYHMFIVLDVIFTF